MEALPPSEWLETAIRIDTTTDRSNEDLVRFLVPLLEGSGLKVREHRVREKGVSFFNLLAFTDAPDARGLLALNTHLDTVPAGDRSAWTSTGGDPFRLTADGDRLYGLGSADVKLDFLCKLWAFRHARRDGGGRPIALVGSYEDTAIVLNARAAVVEISIAAGGKVIGGGRARVDTCSADRAWANCCAPDSVIW